jgi:hypothetical protein
LTTPESAQLKLSKKQRRRRRCKESRRINIALSAFEHVHVVIIIFYENILLIVSLATVTYICTTHVRLKLPFPSILFVSQISIDSSGVLERYIDFVSDAECDDDDSEIESSEDFPRRRRFIITRKVLLAASSPQLMRKKLFNENNVR